MSWRVAPVAFASPQRPRICQSSKNASPTANSGPTGSPAATPPNTAPADSSNSSKHSATTSPSKPPPDQPTPSQLTPSGLRPEPLARVPNPTPPVGIHTTGVDGSSSSEGFEFCLLSGASVVSAGGLRGASASTQRPPASTVDVVPRSARRGGGSRARVRRGRGRRSAVDHVVQFEHFEPEVSRGRRLDRPDSLQFDPLAGDALEEADTVTQQDRHQVDLELIEQTGLEALADNGGASPDANVLIAGGGPRTLQRRLKPLYHEVVGRPALHRHRIARLVREHEYRKVAEGRRVAPRFDAD